MGRNLHAHSIDVMFVNMVKTRRLRSCSLPFAGGARSHIIEDVCQGNENLFPYFCLSTLHSLLVDIYYVVLDQTNMYVPVHRKIAFDDVIENGVFLFQRAWDGLLPKNRILIYCL